MLFNRAIKRFPWRKSPVSCSGMHAIRLPPHGYTIMIYSKHPDTPPSCDNCHHHHHPSLAKIQNNSACCIKVAAHVARMYGCKSDSAPPYLASRGYIKEPMKLIYGIHLRIRLRQQKSPLSSQLKVDIALEYPQSPGKKCFGRLT